MAQNSKRSSIKETTPLGNLVWFLWLPFSIALLVPVLLGMLLRLLAVPFFYPVRINDAFKRWHVSTFNLGHRLRVERTKLAINCALCMSATHHPFLTPAYDAWRTAVTLNSPNIAELETKQWEGELEAMFDSAPKEVAHLVERATESLAELQALKEKDAQ